MSDKAVSKWETQKGLPDISILEDGDYYASIPHEMTKKHYISFLAYVTSNRMQLVKLYPEQSLETRFQIAGRGVIYAFCNLHGLFMKQAYI